MKKNILLILLGIFIFGYLINVLFLPKLSLSFYYDTARDAFTVQEIISGDLKILGPPASTPGLYHGVFYYYFLVPPYLFGHGSPIVAAYWIALFNAGTVFIVFYLTFLLTKKVGAGLLAAFLFAISFESTQYATWLSNPTLGIWTVPLIYLGLWIWIAPGVGGKLKEWGPIISALGLGLSIQSEIFLVYHIVPIVIWLWFVRKNIKKYDLFKFFIILVLVLSPMILAEIKFGFRGINGFVSLLTNQDAVTASKNLGDFIVLFLNELGRVFALSAYPSNIGYGGIFILALLVISLLRWKKYALSWEPFLASWLLSFVTIVSVGGISTPFLLVGTGPAVSIILGIFIYKWFVSGRKNLALVILFLVVFSNLAMIFKENPNGSTLFAIQKDLILNKELPAIDYVYRVGGKNFAVNTLTNPLWINTTWSYLFNWYGKEKYGYLPEWYGRDQIGLLGNNLTSVSSNTKVYIFIIEPMQGIPGKYLGEELSYEDSFTTVVEEKTFGEIRVQKRIKNAK